MLEGTETTPAGQPIVSREKTAPFLIRTFIKIGSFHRLTLFEDGTLPTTDEQQIFTWKDATLREVLTTLRSTAPNTPEFRHPLARYSFRAVYADAASRGRFAQKDLGVVYSRDILGEPGALHAPAPRLREDADAPEPGAREREERTLGELRLVPGDYLCVAVLLPKSVTVPGPAGEMAIKGSAAAPAPAPNGWRGAAGVASAAGGARAGDGGWGGAVAPAGGPPGSGRGGGHWRGESNAPAGRGRGGRRGGATGEFPSRDRDRDRDREADRPREGDRWVPPRRESPPGRGGWGDRGRDKRSRSRSPPRRRNTRYD